MQTRDKIDAHAGMQIWALLQDVAQDCIFVRQLGFGAFRIFQCGAILVAEHVVAFPRHHIETSVAEHRRKRGLQESLAGLAIVAQNRHSGLARISSDCRNVGSGRRREVDEGHPFGNGRHRVEDRTRDILRRTLQEFGGIGCWIRPLLRQFPRAFGRRQINHRTTRGAFAGHPLADIAAQSFDHFDRRQQQAIGRLGTDKVGVFRFGYAWGNRHLKTIT